MGLFKNIKINNFINYTSTSQFIFNTDKLFKRKTFEYQSHRVHCEILKVKFQKVKWKTLLSFTATHKLNNVKCLSSVLFHFKICLNSILDVSCCLMRSFKHTQRRANLSRRFWMTIVWVMISEATKAKCPICNCSAFWSLSQPFTSSIQCSVYNKWRR